MNTSPHPACDQSNGPKPPHRNLGLAAAHLKRVVAGLHPQQRVHLDAERLFHAERHLEKGTLPFMRSSHRFGAQWAAGDVFLKKGLRAFFPLNLAAAIADQNPTGSLSTNFDTIDMLCIPAHRLALT